MFWFYWFIKKAILGLKMMDSLFNKIPFKIYDESSSYICKGKGYVMEKIIWISANLS